MVKLGTSNYTFKIAPTFIMKSFFMITPRLLIVFKLPIFVLFNLSLLICTFLVKKVFQIFKVAND